MAENKKGFVLYADLIHTINKMPSDKAGDLFKHILSYVNDEDPTTDDMLIELVFEPIKQQLKRDLRKYEDKKKQWSDAGKRSAEVRKAKKNEQTLTTVKKRSTDSTVKDNDIVNVKDKVKDNNINNSQFIKKCLSDSQWLEISAMQNKIKIDVIQLFITTFENHLITMEEQKNSLKEFKSHFIHWLKKQDLSKFRVKKMGKTNQI